MSEWRTDMENAPTDGATHVRGLMVQSRLYGSQWFEAIAGHVDDDGDFVDHNGDSPWRAEDYQWWMPLPPPPQDASQ